MKTSVVATPLKDRLEGLFRKHAPKLLEKMPPPIKKLRQEAFESFIHTGFPHTRMEEWRNTDLASTLRQEYDIPLEPFDSDFDLQRVFRCHIPHLNTNIIAQLNGWYVYQDAPLTETSGGLIIGSLSRAFERFPDLVSSYFNAISDHRIGGLESLNMAFARDGVFIYVPDNTVLEKPIQMVNVIRYSSGIMIQNRNLVVLGKNTRVTLVHCDDSFNENPSFTNVVTEVIVGENAVLEHYKLQNLNNLSTLINTMYFSLQRGSKVMSNGISLNGGLIRNDLHLRFNGEEAEANLYGLYLMDKNQHIDNHVVVDHAAPRCNSNQLFKGILDEHATGVFSGKVIVERDAQKTEAYQNNRNILLTDTARIDSKPFLEIYADDVKCSHGSTVGQLDQDAMFYLRSRGIGESQARMLLMYAFAAEVIGKIGIIPLRNRIEDMVKKRLRGELSVCDDCVLHCSTPEKPMEFEIDVSKL